MGARGDRILVALDVPTLDEALSLVAQLRDHIGGFKIGLELCTNVGTQRVIDAIHEAGGNVFVDLKFKDIPNTVAGAARALTRSGVLMFNIHCDGGTTMMRAAVDAVRTPGGPSPLVVGVTMLTSLDQEVMNRELEIAGPIQDHVVHLARLAQYSGLDGVVCSGQEIAAVKAACGSKFLTVVPGIRPAWALTGDQTRVMTPHEAIQAGADYLVIGRPITHPPDIVGTPMHAVRRILAEVAEGPNI